MLKEGRKGWQKKASGKIAKAPVNESRELMPGN
jgi:hypothetical protein